MGLETFGRHSELMSDLGSVPERQLFPANRKSRHSRAIDFLLGHYPIACSGSFPLSAARPEWPLDTRFKAAFPCPSA